MNKVTDLLDRWHYYFFKYSVDILIIVIVNLGHNNCAVRIKIMTVLFGKLVKMVVIIGIWWHLLIVLSGDTVELCHVVCNKQLINNSLWILRNYNITFECIKKIGKEYRGLCFQMWLKNNADLTAHGPLTLCLNALTKAVYI